MLNNLSMQIKVIVLLALIAAVGVGAVLYTDSSLGGNIDKYDQALTGPAPGTVALARSGRHAAWTSRSILKAIIATDATKLAKAEKDIEDGKAKFNAEMDKAEKSLPNKVSEFKPLREKYNAAMSSACAEVASLAQAGQKDAAIAAMDNGCGPQLLEVMTGVAGVVDRTIEENNALAASLQKSADTDIRNANIFGLIGLLVAGSFAVWLTRTGISAPVVRLDGLMGQMAKGKLDVVIPGQERRDEIGSMSRTAEAFRQGLMEAETLRASAEQQKAVAEAERRAAMLRLADDFEKSVGGIVSLVSSAATEMQAAASQLSATAQEASAQSIAVSAAAEEAGANVTSVAASTEELGASVGEIGRQMETSASVAANAVREAEEAQTVVSELNETAASIGGVVDLIAGLANQTNLLALNATIESARAGEAGKGFAVVAAEVKALASQTAKATTDISDKIAKIQDATNRAATTMRNIAGTIQSLNHSSTAIASAVEQQSAATQEIIQAVNQASVGTQEVNSNIAGVAQAAEQTGEAAVQVQNSSAELATQAERLHHEMDKFLQTVRAA
ncbi:methyl-accepting chemotaxis protein [Asticcacaulis sp. DXS10W]|uniref:Methyl-accepting chemotaxis protein n=1 Tax=Asticcacaulis currens TaxID=2984210 RepID=A0ABT5IED2_9CAUL|nr:methyl-accepting chemotaxis protein [Asticcacaulis currens]MDC7694549.1 methyl-accepting chemotaxis protein [Asticcacaulis currens]